ncbi:MAG: Exopolysaccharide biosynthesis protein [Rhodobacteraceae bacterium HLUCCO18]|nr:MAG: Exopolysaccharide biosynthesis protein [Rhodobacteraceae bacterium HLUCCO18]
MTLLDRATAGRTDTHRRATRQTHADVVHRLCAMLDRILSPLVWTGTSRDHTLLDFPDHANVGDSAIYAGEVAWLREKTGRGPGFVGKLDADGDWDRAAIPTSGPILLHGGGNFGDIYPRHQNFREELLGTFRDRPLVQLPQSIHFGDACGVDRTAASIANHRDFTLLTRDHESHALAHRHFDCRVEMCPDMAFGLGTLQRPAPPVRDVLLLLRTDVERVTERPGRVLPTGWHVADWMGEPADVHARALRSARTLALRSANPLDLRRRARRVAYYDALAQQRIDRGLRLLGSARFVITDRLHGHILCTLMGIPHAVLDNSYGKIARFARAFATVWDGVVLADGLTEAIGAAEDWLARNGGALQTGKGPDRWA